MLGPQPRLTRPLGGEPTLYSCTGLAAVGKGLLASFWQVRREITVPKWVNRATPDGPTSGQIWRNYWPNRAGGYRPVLVSLGEVSSSEPGVSWWRRTLYGLRWSGTTLSKGLGHICQKIVMGARVPVLRAVGLQAGGAAGTGVGAR